MKKITDKIVALMAVVALGLSAANAPSAGTIFKCEREDGTVEFSQAPCASSPEEQVTLKTARSGRVYAVTEAESADLADPGSAPGEGRQPAEPETPTPAPAAPPTEPAGP